MIDLAISMDADQNGTSIIETNKGRTLKAARWPQDSDFQLVAYAPSGRVCKVVGTESLAKDIACALAALKQAGVIEGRKPDWLCRLESCARGASEHR